MVKNRIPDINTWRINGYLDLNILVVFVHVLNVAVLKRVWVMDVVTGENSLENWGQKKNLETQK